MNEATKPVWHSGPPPHVGWWNTTISYDNEYKTVWRWWDGSEWSCALFVPEEDAHTRASRWCSAFESWATPAHSCVQHRIQWCDYYPENARVPRVNPEAARPVQKPLPEPIADDLLKTAANLLHDVIWMLSKLEKKQ